MIALHSFIDKSNLTLVIPKTYHRKELERGIAFFT